MATLFNADLKTQNRKSEGKKKCYDAETLHRISKLMIELCDNNEKTDRVLIMK